MEHLILPEGAKPWMKLAYDCPEDQYYENIPVNETEYSEFYKRVNFRNDEAWWQPKKNDDLMGGVEEGALDKIKEPWEYERFYQTWLFFGLIIEVFGLSGIQVKTTDFLLPITKKTVHKPQTARLINTSRLPELIKQWRQTHQVTRDEKIIKKAVEILDFVGNIIDYHCVRGKIRRSINQYGKVLWPLSDETTTAIIAVAWALRKNALLLLDTPIKDGRWPVTNSRLLYQRIQRKWCKSDAMMIMEDFDIDGQNYIAAAQGRSLEDLDAHYACTEQSCEAKITDGTYETLHDPDCDQDDYEPEPKFIEHVYPDYGNTPNSMREAIKTTMGKNHLPVLRWDAEQKGFKTYGHEKDSYNDQAFNCPPFVAISHVWADGKGNPFDNSLPYCQLAKIQTFVDDLCANYLPEKLRHSAPGFWMDTLCCIVGTTEEDRKAKKKSIESMREIYGESVAVLILDPWLQSIPSTASESEICYRIYASGWSRRLWTHQEGFLARQVYYQFKDKPISLPEISEIAMAFQAEQVWKGFPISFPQQASGKTSFYYTTVKTIVNGIRQGHIAQDNKWMIYNHLADSLGYRSTTNIDDEMLCVASVIGSSVKDYASLADEAGRRQHTAELRMKAFLEEIGRFRQSIIFNNYKRLSIPGFRWAPASLLGHRASGMGDTDDSKDSKIEDYSHLNLNDIHVELSMLGIKVNINKYIPRSLGIDRQYMSMMLKDKTILLPTVGLPVDYPGYVIRFSSKTHGLTINMAERRFGISYSPLPIGGWVKTPPLPSMPTMPAMPAMPTMPSIPSMPSMPSMPKVPSFGKKIGGFGKPAAAPVKEEVPRPASPVPSPVPSPETSRVSSPLVERTPDVLTYKYVVFVGENDVEWAYDREYVVILQRPLGQVGSDEFLAMVGRKSVGPGKRYWVQSLCSALVRVRKPTDDLKVDAGIDYVDVDKPATNWVVT